MANNWGCDKEDTDMMLFELDLDNPCSDQEMFNNGSEPEVIEDVIADAARIIPNATPITPAKKSRVGYQERIEVNDTSKCPSIKKSDVIPARKSNSVTGREPLQHEPKMQQLSFEATAEKKLTFAEKARLADIAVSIFFGKKPPLDALKDYNESLPKWDVLRDPFSYKPPIRIEIDSIIYYINYIKLENKGRTTHFKFVEEPTEEAIKYSDLTLELGGEILYFRAHAEITIYRKAEWVLHKTLSDRSLLFLINPINETMCHKK